MSQSVHTLQLIARTEKDNINIAIQLSQIITTPSLIFLEGNLGSGKTTFTKYFFQQYGLNPNQVKSPTYSLINSFKTLALEINHLDLYRLDQPDPVLYQEILSLCQIPNSITAIEWPERLPLLDEPQLTCQKIHLQIDILSNNWRQFTIKILT